MKDMKMDAQDEHDHLMAMKDKGSGNSLAGSKERLESLLAKKKKNSVQSNDPISAAMANNPELTLERALKIADEFGC